MTNKNIKTSKASRVTCFLYKKLEIREQPHLTFRRFNGTLYSERKNFEITRNNISTLTVQVGGF